MNCKMGLTGPNETTVWTSDAANKDPLKGAEWEVLLLAPQVQEVFSTPYTLSSWTQGGQWPHSADEGPLGK